MAGNLEGESMYSGRMVTYACANHGCNQKRHWFRFIATEWESRIRRVGIRFGTLESAEKQIDRVWTLAFAQAAMRVNGSIFEIDIETFGKAPFCAMRMTTRALECCKCDAGGRVIPYPQPRDPTPRDKAMLELETFKKANPWMDL